METLKRRAYIAGNWKMNMDRAKTKEFFAELKPLVQNSKSNVVLCVPFTDLETALREVEGTKIEIAAQNCHFEEKGAYTGEISAKMLKEMGVYGVILGHSERRTYFNETDETVNLKLKAALKEGLAPIVCVGETLKQRQNNITFEVISKQLKVGLKDIAKDEAREMVLAYEPVWAIGTGKNATKQEAQEVCSKIRDIVKNMFGQDVSDVITILYGGSMKPSNCKDLFLQKDIDGGLIGGASLKVSEFYDIVKIADEF